MEVLKDIQEKFNSSLKGDNKLFRVELSGDDIWDLYLNGFTREDDPVFRDPESTVHNCNHCKNFIRRYGNVVAIDKNNKIITMFDVDVDNEFKNSMESMSDAIKNSKVVDVFYETFDMLKSLPYDSCKKSDKTFRLGVEKNHKTYTAEEAQMYDSHIKEGDILVFNHFNLDIPSKFVDKSGESEASIMSKYRSAKEVFKRGMDEFKEETLELVTDLINQKSILDGKQHLSKITTMLSFIKEYNKVPNKYKDNWAWRKSYDLGIAKFRNELMGTLCSDIAKGESLDKACLDWNKRVDPSSYMKAKAPITEAQKKKDRKLIENLGYLESLTSRRFANIDDIDINEIRYINDAVKKQASIFDSVKTSSNKPKINDNIKEVSIEEFTNNILPNSSKVEALFENRLENNLVCLTTGGGKNMFGYSNKFNITYKGNLAGKSFMKENIKRRGGNTNGVLNIRLAFPETSNDYDLHVLEPNGNKIYYSNLRSTHTSSGRLDLDANGLDGQQTPDNRVENVIYTDLHKMPDGVYKIGVHDYSNGRFPTNFNMEVEFGGNTNTMEYHTNGKSNFINVCEVTKKGNELTFDCDNKDISSSSMSKDTWNIKTNEFHNVKLVCQSPNHWGENSVGDKHYLFMLDGCKSDEPIRHFHIKDLNTELKGAKKTLERLGQVNLLEPTDKQLCGLGFNETVTEEIILKVEGNKNELIKVKF